MAVKMEIPTALRQFAGKQASVEFNAATVGEALKQLTGAYARPAQASLHRGWAHSQLREYLPQ